MRHCRYSNLPLPPQRQGQDGGETDAPRDTFPLTASENLFYYQYTVLRKTDPYRSALTFWAQAPVLQETIKRMCMRMDLKMRKMRPCTASCSAFPLRSAWPALTAPRWQKTKIANPPCLPPSWLLSEQLPFPLHRYAKRMHQDWHRIATVLHRELHGMYTGLPREYYKRGHTLPPPATKCCSTFCHCCHRQLRIVAVRSATASYECCKYVLPLLPPPSYEICNTFPPTQTPPLTSPAPSIRGCTMSLQHPARRPPTTSGAF